MEKPSDVIIVSISAAGTQSARGHGSLAVVGLGDDQKVYVWDSAGHKWNLFA